MGRLEAMRPRVVWRAGGAATLAVFAGLWFFVPPGAAYGLFSSRPRPAQVRRAAPGFWQPARRPVTGGPRVTAVSSPSEAWVGARREGGLRSMVVTLVSRLLRLVGLVPGGGGGGYSQISAAAAVAGPVGALRHLPDRRWPDAPAAAAAAASPALPSGSKGEDRLLQLVEAAEAAGGGGTPEDVPRPSEHQEEEDRQAAVAQYYKQWAMGVINQRKSRLVEQGEGAPTATVQRALVVPDGMDMAATVAAKATLEAALVALRDPGQRLGAIQELEDASDEAGVDVAGDASHSEAMELESALAVVLNGTFAAEQAQHFVGLWRRGGREDGLVDLVAARGGGPAEVEEERRKAKDIRQYVVVGSDLRCCAAGATPGGLGATAAAVPQKEATRSRAWATVCGLDTAPPPSTEVMSPQASLALVSKAAGTPAADPEDEALAVHALHTEEVDEGNQRLDMDLGGGAGTIGVHDTANLDSILGVPLEAEEEEEAAPQDPRRVTLERLFAHAAGEDEDLQTPVEVTWFEEEHLFTALVVSGKVQEITHRFVDHADARQQFDLLVEETCHFGQEGRPDACCFSELKRVGAADVIGDLKVRSAWQAARAGQDLQTDQPVNPQHAHPVPAPAVVA